MPTKRVADFIASLGINMHLMNYGSVTNTITQMQYLGISNYRDTVWANDSASVAAYTQMGQAGMKLLAINMGDPAGPKPEWDTLAPYLFGIEGPNEVDVDPPASYNGQAAGNASAIAIQQAMYPMVHNDSTLAGIPVLTFTVAQASSSTAFPDLSAYADYTNVHAYGQYGPPPFYYLQPLIGDTVFSSGRPPIVSETGFYTMIDNDSGVNEDVQARWNLATLLDNFLNNVPATFLYELHDESDPGNTNWQSHFGLYRVNDTAKPSAVAIHNLTTLLHDSGSTARTFTPGTMAYSISGVDPYNNFTMALAKSNGAYDVLLWAEPEIWTHTTSTESVPAPATATINFGKVWPNVSVYNVLTSTTPIATYTNVSQVQFGIAAETILVEVSGTTPPIPPVANGTTLFDPNLIPQQLTVNDPGAFEFGVKFIPAVSGKITAIRYYKGPYNTGSHVGNLWSATGTNLASVSFSSETQSGWQQQALTTPVPVTAGTTYVASYHMSSGNYSADTGYFNTSSHTSGRLTAPSTGSSGGNGLYSTGGSAFPTNTYQGTNYWADVVFVPDTINQSGMPLLRMVTRHR